MRLTEYIKSLIAAGTLDKLGWLVLAVGGYVAGGGAAKAISEKAASPIWPSRPSTNMELSHRTPTLE